MSARRARVGTAVVFLVHGLLVSSWVSRIPEVQKKLALSEGVLGTALLAIAVGSLLSMPVAGAFLIRSGSRVVVAWTTLAFCLAVAAIPLASGPASLMVMLFFYGAAAGAMDVAMNAQGVVVESRYGRSIMSSLHALFSVGGMAGALAGGQLAEFGVTVSTHLALAGLTGAVLAALAYPTLLPRNHEPHSAPGPLFAVPHGSVIVLGALGFCILLCEGAMADWIAIYLRDAMSAGPGIAASGYGVFSGAMAAGRFAGDTITDRYGPVRTVRAGAGLGALGLAVALLASEAHLALAGFVAVGIGYAAIVPNVFAASARIPGVASGTGIAAVTTMGYLGFLLGPPTIGWLAEWTGLRHALVLLVFLSAGGSMLAGAVRPSAKGTSPGYEPDPHG